jgi:hypothetical protein
MQNLSLKMKRDRLKIDKLPLAIYLEIAAHLRQIAAVKTELIAQPTCLASKPPFDYLESQVQCLQVEYPDRLDASSQKTIAQILDYYAQRYGSWQQDRID